MFSVSGHNALWYSDRSSSGRAVSERGHIHMRRSQANKACRAVVSSYDRAVRWGIWYECGPVWPHSLTARPKKQILSYSRSNKLFFTLLKKQTNKTWATCAKFGKTNVYKFPSIPCELTLDKWTGTQANFKYTQLKSFVLIILLLNCI